MHNLFFFYCENSFAAPREFCFIKYRLKWLFICKRLPTPDLYLALTSPVVSKTQNKRNLQNGLLHNLLETRWPKFEF